MPNSFIVYVAINPMSYYRFITNIKDGVNGYFEKLYFKFPGESLKDGLRFILKIALLSSIYFSIIYIGGVLRVMENI